MKKVQILTPDQIKQKLNRLAYEIYEHSASEKEIVLAGIEGNGFFVAKKLAAILKKIAPYSIILGEITIDKQSPLTKKTSVNIAEQDYKNKAIFVVDDVLNSGKTLIYAVQLFLNQPVKKLHTVVLVDRSHTHYPVKADFVGLSLSTTLQEHIIADFSIQGKETVCIE
ncbi:MAG: phosphoribosyltransferase [Bacteroidetes bacterium]|nr:phosphoribosyltransferase [Bacteroidota bacterium]